VPTADDGSPTSWPQDVGCVLYEAGDRVVFIDPLAPAADEAAFWQWADERCRGRAVVVLETIGFHRRDRDAVADRYGAVAEPPPGVVAYPFPIAGETVYWLPEPHALVPGDSLVGTGGALSLCPERWLQFIDGTPTLTAVAASLRPLLTLDVRLILVSHGEPTTSDAPAALARALAAA
jgi:hypothetical protein